MGSHIRLAQGLVQERFHTSGFIQPRVARLYGLGVRNFEFRVFRLSALLEGVSHSIKDSHA